MPGINNQDVSQALGTTRRPGRAALEHVLAPRSVAVIGAGRNPLGTGHRVLRNLIGGGFPGRSAR
ncbi:hypothetical protein [Nonomuraea basaltis]|uniref:hypothetical protein n=1 Tax=Nonomuraea basaltis TaxID=2495887 RepID=UPI00110C671F|nr:hypothetical protein [Nonomuraea basaltis]TMS00264.1 hypothetical protein EJK15_02400 [Nonomuraea basaltis]